MNGRALPLAALLLAGAAAAQEASPAKRALLIGINDYATDQFTDLRGAVNDVETVRQVLTQRFGFPEANVTVLTDAAATRAAILAAVRKLVAEAGPKDTVYLHFSGHGSQVKDMDGDEADGRDETIVPEDGRMEGIADITDDELGGILAGLTADRCVLVLDSCHSGTMTRGALRLRTVPADTRLDLYDNSKIRTRSVVRQDRPERCILLTGAADNESALDGPVEGGRNHGMFSYALAKALSGPGGAAPLTAVHDQVQATFRGLSEQFGGVRFPDPQFEGSADRLDGPIFGGGAAPTRLALAVQPEMGGARLLGGAAAGAVPGSAWAVFPAGTTAFAPQSALARLVVTVLEGADARARLEPGGKPVEAGQCAVLASPAPSGARLPVQLEIEPGRRSAFEAGLKAAFPDVELVPAGAFARFKVTVRSGRVEVKDGAGLAVVEAWDAASDGDAVSRLAATLTRSQRASALVSIENPLSSLRAEARAVGPDPLRIKKTGEARTPENSLQLEIRTSADAWITVVDVDAAGAINVLFPTPVTKEGFLPEGRVRGGEWVRIPDGLATGNRAGFFWDVQPPAGTDTIQVFASATRAHADAIRSWLAAAPAPATRGGPAAPPPPSVDARRLTDLSGRIAMRGFAVVADTQAPAPAVSAAAPAAPAAAPDWATALVRVRLEE